MTFIIRNNAKISNKYIRFAKWKIRKLASKYGHILYSEIYTKQISARPEIYQVTIKMGVPGPDIVLTGKSNNLKSLWSGLSAKLKRQLRKLSENR